MTFDNVEWYEYVVKRQDGVNVTLSPDQRRCLETLCVMDNIYNIHTYEPLSSGIAVDPWGGVSCLLRSSISTFDCSRLTRLVLAAHRNSVRVEISAYREHLDEDRTERIKAHMRQNFESDFGYEPDDVSLDCFEIRLSPRSPDRNQHWMYFHPSIEDMLK
jgi:hypothetical protein